MLVMGYGSYIEVQTKTGLGFILTRGERWLSPVPLICTRIMPTINSSLV